MHNKGPVLQNRPVPLEILLFKIRNSFYLGYVFVYYVVYICSCVYVCVFGVCVM